MNNQLSVVDGGQPTQVTQSSNGYHVPMPQTIAEIARLADAFAASNMFAVKSMEQAMVVLMTGMEMGLAPAASMRGIHVINGKPSPSADLMIAACQRRPEICKYFEMVHSDDQSATYETFRTSQKAPKRMSFTMDEAKRAGLLKNPTWNNYPAAMLRARASAALARMVYSDITLGLYTPDELGSMTNESTPYVIQEEAQIAAPAPPAIVKDDEWKAEREALLATLKSLDGERGQYHTAAAKEKFGAKVTNGTKETMKAMREEIIAAYAASEPAVEAEFRDEATEEAEDTSDPFAEN